MRYQCKLFWGWSGRYSSFSETTEFYVNDKSEIHEKINQIIVKIARTHAFDCGNLDSPLQPYIHSVEIVPIDEKEVVYLEGYVPLLEREKAWTKHLIETNSLYDGGQYNLKPAPLEIES